MQFFSPFGHPTRLWYSRICAEKGR